MTRFIVAFCRKNTRFRGESNPEIVATGDRSAQCIFECLMSFAMGSLLYIIFSFFDHADYVTMIPTAVQLPVAMGYPRCLSCFCFRTRKNFNQMIKWPLSWRLNTALACWVLSPSTIKKRFLVCMITAIYIFYISEKRGVWSSQMDSVSHHTIGPAPPQARTRECIVFVVYYPILTTPSFFFPIHNRSWSFYTFLFAYPQPSRPRLLSDACSLTYESLEPIGLSDITQRLASNNPFWF